MVTLEQFGRWARRARDEPAPSLDVSGDVARLVRRLPVPGRQTGGRREAPAGPGAPAWLFVGAAACAAAVLAAVGFHAWAALTHPLGTWIQQIADWGIL